MKHGRVSPGVEIKTKSVCSTRPHTRACDLSVWHKSIYPTGLARPSTRHGTRVYKAILKGTRPSTWVCGLAV
ncbi:hypothetical protein F383_28091 [Gossypium arboreum]|uniref:Uncharacterized protein n=1 Tax=Gossypium arboreum TaxID=29729 RepID=A0A0B0MV45_GOSAR|nr:hypothetical protein F383_28091 [Gossypium arboreum]